MLSLQEYMLLSKTEKAEMLTERGEYVANLVQEKESSILFSLYGYYVEVIIKDSGLAEVIPFEQGERLDKYLDAINLSKLEE